MPLLQLLCIQGKTKHRRKYHHSPEQNLSFFELKIRQQIKEWLVLCLSLLLFITKNNITALACYSQSFVEIIICIV